MKSTECKKDVENYQQWLSYYTSALNSMDMVKVQQFVKLLRATNSQANGKILLIGNGGSASNVEHFAIELTKELSGKAKHLSRNILSLCSNTGIFSAFANDFSFETVFSEQIRIIGRSNDLLIALTTSGRSPNILAGLKMAKGIGMNTIVLCGNNSDFVEEISDLTIEINLTNPGLIESAHLFLLHVVRLLY